MPDQSEKKSVAWLAHETFHSIDAVQSELHRYGLVVNTSDTVNEQVAVRLLHVDNYSSLDELLSAYLSIDAPALLVVKSDNEEITALQFLREMDDVCKSDAPLRAICARLNRLLLRSRHPVPERILRADPLTGLLTRQALREEFSILVEPALVTSTESWAITFLDLDGFKVINDTFGHQFGDLILTEAAHLLLAECGPNDRVFRLGGDEFVMVLARYDPQTLLDAAERIRQRMALHAFHNAATNKDIHLTASIGVTLLGPQSTFEDSLRQGDMAMYQAKEKGRNRVVCFQAMQDSEAGIGKDIYVQHFENVTRVVTERVSTLISQLGSRLIDAARQEANNDALTQLHNRRYLDIRLAREFEMARKHGRSLTVALMDIDNFSNINTTYGWPTGDQMLKVFSRIASENIRLVDWLARYGGEEFLLVMLDTDLEQGIAIAERIRAAVAKSENESVDHRLVRFTVSIGMAKLNEDIDSPVTLVQQASKALIHSKKSGRNRVCHNY